MTIMCNFSRPFLSFGREKEAFSGNLCIFAAEKGQILFRVLAIPRIKNKKK